STCHQLIHVRDMTAPTLATAQGSDDTIECPAEPQFTAPTYADDCSDVTVVEDSDVRVPGPCAGSYTRTKTWHAVDACGNATGPVSQSITVRATQGPTISEPSTLGGVLACNSPAPQPESLTASDACEGTVPVNTHVDDSDNGCYHTRVITYSAEDCSHNAAT